MFLQLHALDFGAVHQAPARPARYGQLNPFHRGWAPLAPSLCGVYIGLAGRRVPIALAVVPAALISVLLIVGGITLWSALDQMSAATAAGGADAVGRFWEMFVMVGPILLFPVWGAALAVATLGYYFRRRGPCRVCGRGAGQ